jgi:hypothetical protein
MAAREARIVYELLPRREEAVTSVPLRLRVETAR